MMEVCARGSATFPVRFLCAGGVSDGRRQSRSGSAVSVPWLSWCPGFGRPLASAALLRTVPGPETDYQPDH